MVAKHRVACFSGLSTFSDRAATWQRYGRIEEYLKEDVDG